MSNDFAARAKLIVDVLDEMRLVQTILHYARSDAGLLRAATDLKSSLEKALADGVKSLRVPREPGEEALKVEAPIARQRLEAGHQIRRQHRCFGGVVDLFDITADELIECKARGTSAALGEAAGQLKRYGRSFPGSRLTIAVISVEAEAAWLADVLRREGIEIIEVGDGSG